MTELIAVAAGGALGAFTRFFLGNLSKVWFDGARVLTGTLFSNLIGCLLGGIALGWIVSDNFMESAIALFITVGYLGSLTTFSTFALEAYGLMNRDSLKKLAAYLFLQLIVAFSATVLGYFIFQLVNGHG